MLPYHLDCPCNNTNLTLLLIKVHPYKCPVDLTCTTNKEVIVIEDIWPGQKETPTRPVPVDVIPNINYLKKDIPGVSDLIYQNFPC